MNNHPVLALIGLAERAGKILHGEEPALHAIQSGTAQIVFLASDAGVNTSKRIHDKCASHNIFLYDSFTGDELAKSVGRVNRKVLSLVDKGFSRLMLSKIQDSKKEV